MALTTTQIEALEAAGGSRWTKAGHDRIYFNIDTIPGVEIRNPERKGGYLALDGETFSNRCDTSIRSLRCWVDVATGETHIEHNNDRKVAGEIATLVERFEGLVAGLLAVEETGTPDEIETAEARAAVAAETIRVRIADHVPAAKRGRLVRQLINRHGAKVDGDIITLPAEVWAQPRESVFGDRPTPGRWAEVPRGRMVLASQGNLVVVP